LLFKPPLNLFDQDFENNNFATLMATKFMQKLKSTAVISEFQNLILKGSCSTTAV